jgi:P27 family predicted phage terminase small subunit
MPRGRPPKPTTQHWLAGDPSKRKRYQIEPAPPQDEPGCPDWLDAVAKEQWDHTTGILRDMRLLSKADRTGLARYCQTWSMYCDARAKVAKAGTVILSPDKKFPMPSPWYTILKQCDKDLTAFEDRFGLNPSGRAKLAVDASLGAQSDPKWMRLIG